MKLEVVVTDASEALEAQNAGASRVELVARLDLGGLTPDYKTIEAVTRAVTIPVHVMIRPHDDGFFYDREQRRQIIESAAAMRDLGATCIVFGALDERNHVAVDLVQEVLGASGLPLTFHRAFDETPSLSISYVTLAGIDGVQRILTTGGAPTAWDGREQLRELCSGNTVPAILGAGAIEAANLPALIQFTGLREVHVARGARTDGKIDANKIQQLSTLLHVALDGFTGQSDGQPGANFEREINEQPDVWRRIAHSDKARTLAAAIRERDVLLVGSGSSLFISQLGALALRKCGINAQALSATESVFDSGAYRRATVIACSQSGESRDLLDALEVIEPSELIALTNGPGSSLARRSDVCIDVGAGPELAVPASKSVSSTAAILAWAAGILSGKPPVAQSLIDAAQQVTMWLNSGGVDDVREAAQRIARRRSVIIVASGYGLPIAQEFALKLKEASYIHAEGFSAGEFLHGSVAMLDAACVVIGIVDERSRNVVNRALTEAAKSEALPYVVGGRLGEIPLLGPIVDEPFNSLAWLVTAQELALHVGRARSIESDAPRGLVKALV